MQICQKCISDYSPKLTSSSTISDALLSFFSGDLSLRLPKNFIPDLVTERKRAIAKCIPIEMVCTDGMMYSIIALVFFQKWGFGI